MLFSFPEELAMTTTTPKQTVRLKSDPLRLERGETVHVGVDVHKRAYHVAVLSDHRGYLATWVQPADPALLCDRLRPIRKQVAWVVYEAGPTGFTLALWLRKADLAADVIAPRQGDQGRDRAPGLGPECLRQIAGLHTDLSIRVPDESGQGRGDL